MNQYLTIKTSAEALLKDKNSKFYGYSFPISTTQEVKVIIDELRKSHHNARHFCYAFRIGLDGNLFRSNDDGEPSGTAGKPILGQIDSKKLVNVLIVIVRYFGGTKLGVSGLINAYKTTAKLVLSNSEIIQKELLSQLKIQCTHENVPFLLDILKKKKVSILEKSFADLASFTLLVKKSQEVEILLLIKDFVNDEVD